MLATHSAPSPGRSRFPLWNEAGQGQRVFIVSSLFLSGFALLAWGRVGLSDEPKSWQSFAFLAHALAAVGVILAWVLRGLPNVPWMEKTLPSLFVFGSVLGLIAASIAIETGRFTPFLGVASLACVGGAIIGVCTWTLQMIDVRGTKRRARFFALGFLVSAFFLSIPPLLRGSISDGAGRLEIPVLLCVAGSLIPTTFRLSLKRTNANPRERRLLITAASVAWGLVVAAQIYQAFIGRGPFDMGPLAIAPFLSGVTGLVILTAFLPFGWLESSRESHGWTPKRRSIS